MPSIIIGTVTGPASVASSIAASSEKTTPVDADIVPITDSEDAGALKWLTLANLWAWVKSKLDAAMTIAGTKTFSGQVELTGQSAANGTSAMTRLLASLESALSGHEFRQLAIAVQQNAGVGASAGSYLALGMFAQIYTANGSSASCYTFDSVHTHSGFSGALMRADKEIDVCFHGVMLRVEANQNWVLRINFGVGSPTRVPPEAGADPASGRQWGVEFYYDGSGFVGRIYHYNTGPTSYGTPFSIPGISSSNWVSMVYSLRMRQTAAGQLEVYMSSPTSALGSTRIPNTPTATVTAAWSGSTHTGRYINFEASAAAAAAPATGVRIHCATMHCRYVL